ncbi:hypothetical protein MTF65_22145 [Streptomyces sp. APSN-46.1]|uniref:hypothetical protein n=1 Tax=Streptomyces sp. APSN-46.1 TaxID=2929049 RepID=UPI001FB38B57|nr:hypothetical protein [Streptomyces sp. APSN-46.1]MCJ1679996.1 hypothetical protein [Streptomyces sp. APSN-46.1]
MLTDRDERALLAAAENRISEPLRIGAALAAVRRALARRPARAADGREPHGREQDGRESVSCQQQPPQTTPAAPLPQ